MSDHTTPIESPQPIDKVIAELERAVYDWRWLGLDKLFPLTEYERGYAAGQQYALDRLRYHTTENQEREENND